MIVYHIQSLRFAEPCWALRETSHDWRHQSITCSRLQKRNRNESQRLPAFCLNSSKRFLIFTVMCNFLLPLANSFLIFRPINRRVHFLSVFIVAQLLNMNVNIGISRGVSVLANVLPIKGAELSRAHFDFNRKQNHESCDIIVFLVDSIAYFVHNACDFGWGHNLFLRYWFCIVTWFKTHSHFKIINRVFENNLVVAGLAED